MQGNYSIKVKWSLSNSKKTIKKWEGPMQKFNYDPFSNEVISYFLQNQEAKKDFYLTEKNSEKRLCKQTWSDFKNLLREKGSLDLLGYAIDREENSKMESVVNRNISKMRSEEGSHDPSSLSQAQLVQGRPHDIPHGDCSNTLDPAIQQRQPLEKNQKQTSVRNFQARWRQKIFSKLSRSILQRIQKNYKEDIVKYLLFLLKEIFLEQGFRCHFCQQINFPGPVFFCQYCTPQICLLDKFCSEQCQYSVESRNNCQNFKHPNPPKIVMCAFCNEFVHQEQKNLKERTHTVIEIRTKEQLEGYRISKRQYKREPPLSTAAAFPQNDDDEKIKQELVLPPSYLSEKSEIDESGSSYSRVYRENLHKQTSVEQAEKKKQIAEDKIPSKPVKVELDLKLLKIKRFFNFTDNEPILKYMSPPHDKMTYEEIKQEILKEQQE